MASACIHTDIMWIGYSYLRPGQTKSMVCNFPSKMWLCVCVCACACVCVYLYCVHAYMCVCNIYAPYLVGRVVHVAKNNNLSLPMICMHKLALTIHVLMSQPSCF